MKIKHVLIDLLINRLGIDRAITWTLLDSIWKVLRGPLTIFFIVKYLNPVEQGLWYSFISLGALTMIAELGFTYLITQFISHEYAKLVIDKGFIKGKKYYRERLFSLVEYSMKFYFIAILVAVIILFVAGSIVYKEYSQIVRAAWYSYILVSAINLYITLLQSIYQGLNQVSIIRKNIFIGTVINTFSTWIFLITGIGIWSLIAAGIVFNLIMAIIFYIETRQFWCQFIRHKRSTNNKWLGQIISLQWKYGITWISGYFMFYFMVPATLYYIGAIEAGQLGLSLAIFSAVSGIAVSWTQTKVPIFNIYVSNNKRKELNTLFTGIQNKTFWINITLNFFALIIIKYIFPIIGWSDRVLSIENLFILGLISIPSLIIINWAYYLRAHKIEPYMVISLLNGLLVATVVFVSLKYFSSINLLLICYCILQYLLLIPAKIIFDKIQKNEKIIN